MVFNTLVLSGGSIKGVSFLGALQYIDEVSGLKNINQLYGTSAGSIICILLALGVTPPQLLAHFTQFKFSIAPTVSKTEIELVCYTKFIATLQHIVCLYVDKIPTLNELYKIYGKKVFILTYNYTKGKGEVLGYQNYPDMLCTDAVRLSCALPFIFGKTTYNGDLYFDGGLYCNFPLNIAIRQKAQNIVAINLSTKNTRSAVDTHLAIFFNLFFAPIEERTRDIIQKYRKQCAIIEINVPVPFTNLQLSLTQAFECYIYGYIGAKKELMADTSWQNRGVDSPTT